MPEDLKVSQIGSSPLPPQFRGLHSTGVRKHCQIIFACYFRKSSIENDTTCSFCRKERDSVNHIFWSCTYVGSFWEQFQVAVHAGCSNATSVTLNENIVQFGHDIHFKSDNTFDLIRLQGKFFIYKYKVNKAIPQLHLFKRYLKKATLCCTNIMQT